MNKTANPFANLSDSEEELLSDALTELLTIQRKVIQSAEEALNAYELEAAPDPVRVSAEGRIIGSLFERRDRIQALLTKLFD